MRESGLNKTKKGHTSVRNQCTPPSENETCPSLKHDTDGTPLQTMMTIQGFSDSKLPPFSYTVHN